MRGSGLCERVRAAEGVGEVLLRGLQERVQQRAACGGAEAAGCGVGGTAGACGGPLELGGVDVKRRGFLGGLLGLFVAPVAARLPSPASGLALLEGQAVTIIAPTAPGLAAFAESVTWDLERAERVCNPPVIADGEFIRMYREELGAAFEQNVFLRDVALSR